MIFYLKSLSTSHFSWNSGWQCHLLPTSIHTANVERPCEWKLGGRCHQPCISLKWGWTLNFIEKGVPHLASQKLTVQPNFRNEIEVETSSSYKGEKERALDERLPAFILRLLPFSLYSHLPPAGAPGPPNLRFPSSGRWRHRKEIECRNECKLSFLTLVPRTTFFL